MKKTERKIYTWYSLFSEIGGILQLLTWVCEILTSMCVGHRLTALLGNRMYKWTDKKHEANDIEEPKCFMVYNFLSYFGFSRLFKKTRCGKYH